LFSPPIVLPHQGQGASQALEDAEALAAFLKDVPPSGVTAALERVYKARYVRATETQRISRFVGLGPKSIAAGKAQDAKGIDAMQFRDFNWKYYGAERWEKEHPEHVLP
jgi:salicylate hydroxylase